MQRTGRPRRRGAFFKKKAETPKRAGNSRNPSDGKDTALAARNSVDGADGSRGAQTVDGRADDAAGESCSFAAGVKAQDGGGLPGGRVTKDAYRRAAPRLGAGEGRGFEKKALQLTVHNRQTVVQSGTD